jgi:pimeloyl-ACP methyl ester carboxylesterase
MVQTQSPTKGQDEANEEKRTKTRRELTPGRMAVRLRKASRAELVFGAALIVLALHLAVLAIEGQNLFGRAANPLISLTEIVLLPGVFAFFLWRGRIVRTALSVALALCALFVGIGVYVPHLVVAQANASDYTGTLFLVAGVALLGLALWLGLHGHRRLVQVLAIPLLFFVVFQYVMVPAFQAAKGTNTPRPTDPPASTLGIPGARDVSFPASDGVRLVGWYVPGTNGAAVILLHGSHVSRASTLPHLRMLAQAGYAVLAYDARGHGQSDGQTSTLGWTEDNDIAGAITFLGHQPGVDPERIAALGLSMGAMDALRAAADGIALRAVIADGAGAGTFGDLAINDGQGFIAPVALSGDWLSMRAVELFSGTREPPALVSIVGKIRVPVLLIASNNPGELTNDQAYRERMGANAALWYVPDAGHVAALEIHPHDYTARVSAFLQVALFQAS